jgi:polysaccharide export outer membrane protein
MYIEHAPYTDPRIQPNDILQINIQTIDTKSSSELQGAPSPALPAVSAANTAAGAAAPIITGFLVDKDGNVALPLVGKVKIGGLTTAEARDMITKKVSVYYKEPVVNVRFANFSVTVLGEVTRPGTYTITNEKVSLLDAIGIAGDLTIYGKRNNVMLIREEDNKKTFVRFDLNSGDIFRSPYFYLKQGDVVYVEPNKARTKLGTTDPTRDRMLTIGITALSLLVAIFSATRN